MSNDHNFKIVSIIFAIYYLSVLIKQFWEFLFHSQSFDTLPLIAQLTILKLRCNLWSKSIVSFRSFQNTSEFESKIVSGCGEFSTICRISKVWVWGQKIWKRFRIRPHSTRSLTSLWTTIPKWVLSSKKWNYLNLNEFPRLIANISLLLNDKFHVKFRRTFLAWLL